MGDMGDLYSAYRKARQQKRASNRDHSITVLDSEGIKCEVKNYGAHLIVRHGDVVIDYWPGTGLWIDRRDKLKRRGIKRLIVYVRNGGQ